jgi:FixJ family two-component response regulator
MTATVLIVSPDAETRAEYGHHVRAIGYRVHHAETLAQARSLLEDLRPDALVTSLRLDGDNGIHLAHVAHTILPALAVVVVGYRDVVLEAEAASAGAAYVITEEGAEVARALQEAVRAKRPHRRWERKRLQDRIYGRLSGHQAQLVDISYGGFRAEVRGADLDVITRAVELQLPEFGVTAAADPVWTTTGTADTGYVCGAAVSEEHEETGSAWRRFVDLMLDTP